MSSVGWYHHRLNFMSLGAFSRSKSIIFSLASLAYGIGLACLPIDVFKDRSNYLAYADQSVVILARYWSDGLLSSLANEPFWLFINAFLNLFFSSETTVRIIIGVSASISSFMVLKSNPRNVFWLLLFLFLPQIVVNYIVHLRQGVAISFFLIGWFSSSKSMRLIFMMLAPFIHASFFFVVMIFFLTNIFRKLHLASDVRNVFVMLFGILVSIFLSRIASMLGARQATVYEFSAADISGVGFVFWLIVLLLFSLQGRKFMWFNSFAVSVLVFYLSVYFLNVVSGRIFESALLIVLLAGLHLSGWRRQTFLTMIVSYGFFSYLLRLGHPWLGFGSI